MPPTIFREEIAINIDLPSQDKLEELRNAPDKPSEAKPVPAKYMVGVTLTHKDIARLDRHWRSKGYKKRMRFLRDLILNAIKED